MSVKRIFSSLPTQWWRYELRWAHSNRKVSKKKYNYDLNSLIEWNKETHLAFGSPRKPTKTGKLKKTKKILSKELEEQLQILCSIAVSGQHDQGFSELVKSENVGNLESHSNFYEIDVPDHVITSQLPPADALRVFGTTRHVEYSSKNKKYASLKSSDDSNLPDEVFDTLAEFQDAELSSEPSQVKTYSSLRDDEEPVFCKQFKGDGIHIPKIAPIPTSSARISPKSFKYQSMKMNTDPLSIGQTNKVYAYNEHLNVGAPLNQEKSQQIRRFLLFQSQKQHVKNDLYESVKSIKKLPSASSVKTSRTSSNKSQNEKSTEKEAVNPKSEPDASGSITFMPQKSSATHLTSDQLTSTFEPANLPIEAPDSFDIIPKIPLFPKENQDWQQRIDPEQLAVFKMDVEQMSVRVLPSVKTILNKTMPELNRYFLSRWREGMINELGEEGFQKHQEATIKRGVNLHASIMEYLSGKPLSDLQIMPDNEGHWASLQTALTTVTDVRALEMEILHSILLYRGVFDCIARYKDLVCVIDWKTSKKPRPLLKNTYDDPLQIAAYLGALNANEDYVAKFGQMNWGMIVVAYSDGSPSHVHLMNRTVCEQYWQDWLNRLHNFYQLTYTEKMAAKKINATRRV